MVIQRNELVGAEEAELFWGLRIITAYNLFQLDAQSWKTLGPSKG